MSYLQPKQLWDDLMFIWKNKLEIQQYGNLFGILLIPQIKIINPSSGEVIRTLPSEELLRIARSFDQLGNVMVDQKA